MNKLITAAAVSAGILLSTPALARDVKVEIINLTNGLYFTPLLVAAHNDHTDLFEVGTTASLGLQAMAEGGDTSGLANIVWDAGGTVADVSISAQEKPPFLSPGETAAAKIKTKGRRNAYLSITGMLLPTNDGFVGLDALMIPKKRGTYTYLLNAYDAGTEANNELIQVKDMPLDDSRIPGDPSMAGGKDGTGVPGEDHNMTVHVHRGVFGDMDPLSGISDLNSTVHRFNNPVAKVVVTVK